MLVYLRKICPICGNEFTILNTAEEKAIYCTIKCLLDSQNKMNRELFNTLDFVSQMDNS
jgi:hypothetical protein